MESGTETAVTGRTVLGAIQEARLAKACELLSETNAPAVREAPGAFL